MLQRSFALAVCFILLVLTASAQKPNGAYKIVAPHDVSQLVNHDRMQEKTTIKLFKDRHWMVAYPGDPAKPFNGVGGGTFDIRNGRYVEKLDFFSLDSTAVGNEYTFTYQLTPTHFYQEGKVNSERYHDYLVKENYIRLVPGTPLINASLEGAWELREATWGTRKFGEGDLSGVLGIKMYAYPRFAWAYYKPTTKQVLAAGGGTYQFDGLKLIEKLEYQSGTSIPHAIMEINVNMWNEEAYTQTTSDGQNRETWKRSK